MTKKDYSTSFSDKDFWEKIITIPGNTGCSLLRVAYSLYITLKEPSTPAWAKAIIISALGYLICPIDAIPDIIPVVGLTDDLAIMTLVMSQIHAFMNDDIRNKVESMLPERCRGKYTIDPTYMA